MPYKYLNKYPKKFRGTGIIAPLWMAFKRMIKSTIHRPVTIMYPYEKEWVPDNYRGRPGLIFEKCLGCGICVRCCPTTCIELVDVTDDSGKIVHRPQINIGRCMMCGYCAEYCPVNAMTTTTDYELAEFTRQDLIYDPHRLSFDGTNEMMKVHLSEHLLSNLSRGITDKPTAFYEVDKPELNASACISCQKCAKVCPTNSITMEIVGKNAKGKDVKNPKIDVSTCIGCENCVISCPKSALSIKEVL